MMTSLFTRASASLGKKALIKIKAKAMRRGLWFRMLTRAERAQVDLTIEIVKRVRSFILAEVVTSIVKKLLDAMDSKVVRLMREVGPTLAQKLSSIAQKWGNESAHKWATNPSFIQYLTINYMNTPISFQI